MTSTDTEELLLHGSGVRLAATAQGDPASPPVVLLHGGGQTRHAWGSAGAALAADGWLAVSVDLRGHGDSEWAPDGDYRIDAFAADVVAIAGSMSRRPVLIGASLGGLASLVAVGEADGRIASSLVLVDVAPTVDAEGSDRIRGFMRSGMRGFDRLEDAADAISAFLPHRPRPTDLSGLRKNLRERDGRWHWHWDPAFLRGRSGVDGQRGPARHDRLAGAARGVDVPTLLVRGQMSEIVSTDAVAEFRRLIPHAEVVEVGGASHMVAGDRNDAFNDAVVQFTRRSAER